MARRIAWLEQAEASDLADARARSDARTLSERADDAVAWACVTIAELARQATDPDDLRRRLEGDVPPSLRERWERLRGR
ncbi:MAG: hypothetical protein KF729_32360 [Sandaracinaceae bacterium]|nr:hypothetical protein [Sandaracinaceae bacterium]